MTRQSIIIYTSEGFSDEEICGCKRGAGGIFVRLASTEHGLLTSNVGYTGLGLRIPALYGSDFTCLNGPVALGNGITFSSDAPNQSSIGTGDYGLDANGSTLSASIIGLEDATSTITLRFDVPVASFGVDVDYAVTDQGKIVGDDLVISAYDAN